MIYSKQIPEINKVNNAIIQRIYQQIKQEVQDIIDTEMARITSDPANGYMVVKNNKINL